METTTWTYEKLSDLISAQVEESLSIEYKASSALDRDKSPQHEITKDVSAFANSAGGVLIYGIREHRDKAQRHLPEAIDPIERIKAPKEWLEHIIQNIRPRIEGIVIRPISVPNAPEMVIYVVEIPQSGTAHQALDCKYYRRFNFEAVPMADYEIRDVMARQKHPVVDVSCYLSLRTEPRDPIMGDIPFGPARARGPRTEAYLCAVANNVGRKTVNYLSVHLIIPEGLLHGTMLAPDRIETRNGEPFAVFELKNQTRDIVGYKMDCAQYGERRFEPILPELFSSVGSIQVNYNKFFEFRENGAKIFWESYADEAPKRADEFLLSSIEIEDKRKKQGT